MILGPSTPMEHSSRERTIGCTCSLRYERSLDPYLDRNASDLFEPYIRSFGLLSLPETGGEKQRTSPQSTFNLFTEPPAVSVIQVPGYLTPTPRSESTVWFCVACFHRIVRKCWPRCCSRCTYTRSQVHRLSPRRCSQGHTGHTTKARRRCSLGWPDLFRRIKGHVPSC